MIPTNKNANKPVISTKRLPRKPRCKPVPNGTNTADIPSSWATLLGIRRLKALLRLRLPNIGKINVALLCHDKFHQVEIVGEHSLRLGNLSTLSSDLSQTKCTPGEY